MSELEDSSELLEEEQEGGAPGARPPASDRPSSSGELAPPMACLGPDCELEGKLRFRGWLRIEGAVIGEVVGDNLVVAPGGRVKATLEIGQLVVEGAVEGNVRASQAVEIRQRGELRGDVETPSLFVDRGVVFEGRCRVIDRAGPTGQDPE